MTSKLPMGGPAVNPNPIDPIMSPYYTGKDMGTVLVANIILETHCECSNARWKENWYESKSGCAGHCPTNSLCHSQQYTIHHK